MHENPLAEAVARWAEDGGGTDAVWPVPDDSAIHPGTGPNIYSGLTITHWTDDV